ncbi:MAG: hypothetical protein HKN25_14860 [Pyrinomonadaceae bacterium]|nr:hypothetical protein [Pyrinomonadaceae bacterium]
MKKVALLVLTIAFVGIFAKQTHACSCIIPDKPKVFDYAKWLKEHKGPVFFGKVVSIKKDRENYIKTVRFRVERYWKGVEGKNEVTVITALNGAACGVPYKMDEEFFVAAQKTKKGFTTNLCSWLAFKEREAEFQKKFKGKNPKISAGLAALTVPHANNAVASTVIDGKTHVFSFAGLTKGKSWKDTSKQAFMYVEGDTSWQTLPDLPVKLGRLAASAQAVNGTVYIFGGYTVAKDGSEKSTPEVFRFDPKRMKYRRMKDMPTPVDDMVTFTYKDRYIYLVSGWHDNGNVNLVQIYDTKENLWARGSDYPGTPVFGHAGGIVGNRFVIADGVAVVGKTDKGKRIFDTVNEGWMGTIDPRDNTKISYRRLPQLPGRGHYRMAGAGDPTANRVIFVGGTPTAYNYSGIGYNGTPAQAKKHVFVWDFGRDKWIALNDKPTASMDHRGMVNLKGSWYTVGGLDIDREVIDKMLPIK